MMTTAKYDLRVDLQVSEQRWRIRDYCQKLHLHFNPFKYCSVPLFGVGLGSLLLIDTNDLEIIKLRVDKYLKPLCGLHPDWLEELALDHAAIRPRAPYFLWHSGRSQSQSSFQGKDLSGHSALYYQSYGINTMTPIEYCHYRIFSALYKDYSVDSDSATMFPNSCFGINDDYLYESGKSVPVLGNSNGRLLVDACYPVQIYPSLKVRAVSF